MTYDFARVVSFCCRIFGFVARKSGGSAENQCHIFSEFDVNQPASAIVDFVTKVMISQGRIVKS